MCLIICVMIRKKNKYSMMSTVTKKKVTVMTGFSLQQQLKNMVSALYQSRPRFSGGTRDFVKGDQHFGWKTIQDLYKREVERIKSGQITRVPKLKERYVRRDSWTRLNVLPSKVMQVSNGLVCLVWYGYVHMLYDKIIQLYIFLVYYVAR